MEVSSVLELCSTEVEYFNFLVPNRKLETTGIFRKSTCQSSLIHELNRGFMQSRTKADNKTDLVHLYDVLQAPLHYYIAQGLSCSLTLELLMPFIQSIKYLLNRTQVLHYIFLFTLSRCNTHLFILGRGRTTNIVLHLVASTGQNLSFFSVDINFYWDINAIFNSLLPKNNIYSFHA